MVLFDIDGTLIRKAGPHHRMALVDAVQQVTGLITTTEGIPVQGMLDRDILSIMMRSAGLSEVAILSAMPAVVQAAQDIYVRTCPLLNKRVCPNARMLLYKLSRKPNVVTGLVTGNLSRIAWAKMTQAGLRPYLKFGAFAESSNTRAGLIALAIETARREGWIDPESPITHIGDHPNDVLAAHANRIRSVAVTTGLSPAAELRPHNPTLLIDDLSQLPIDWLLQPEETIR